MVIEQSAVLEQLIRTSHMKMLMVCTGNYAIGEISITLPSKQVNSTSLLFLKTEINLTLSLAFSLQARWLLCCLMIFYGRKRAYAVLTAVIAPPVGGRGVIEDRKGVLLSSTGSRKVISQKDAFHILK